MIGARIHNFGFVYNLGRVELGIKLERGCIEGEEVSFIATAQFLVKALPPLPNGQVGLITTHRPPNTNKDGG